MHMHNVFHMILLLPFHSDNDFHRRQVAPPPVTTEEGEEEYKVEKIVSWKRNRNGLWYLVQWKGYGQEEDTMECAVKIAELDGNMESFPAEHPSAPMPKSYKQPREDSKAIEGRIGVDVSSPPLSNTTATTTTLQKCLPPHPGMPWPRPSPCPTTPPEGRCPLHASKTTILV